MPDGTCVLDQAFGRDYALYNADCVSFARGLPDASIDFSVYSPPFAGLYIYSDSAADMGNCADDAEFIRQYGFWLREKRRITRPGRLSAVHCKQLMDYQGRDGHAGWRDFRGALIRAHIEAGWVYHCEVVIWKCPVTEMQRTKSRRLLYKTLRESAEHTGVGTAEYLLVFKRWPQAGEEDLQVPVRHDPAAFPLDWWQEAASPVWMTVNQTRVLNAEVARDPQDEKHICPLQLDVIERAVALWTNRGETVMSPFAGIGSEGVVSLAMGRRFVGTELKPAYFRQAHRNIDEAERMAAAGTLLDRLRAVSHDTEPAGVAA